MILLYHLVFPDDTPTDAWNAGGILRLSAFERQLYWLNRRFPIISLDDYIEKLSKDQSNKNKYAAITFDDGYRNVINLVSPFLIKQHFPATFFVTTSHLEDGRLLWFVYINALCSDGPYRSLEVNSDTLPLDHPKNRKKTYQTLINMARQSGDPKGFVLELSSCYPLPDGVKSMYEGPTGDQLLAFRNSNLLTLGGHTHSHPFLDQISKAEQEIEIRQNKAVLEELSQKPVYYFAYTGGVYTGVTINIVKQEGFEAALAVRPKDLGNNSLFELPRTDIYSPSIIKFGLKVHGGAGLLEKLVRRKR
ncbi:MAG: polysaccharide deacetylase family protein [Syntrophomonadaceae bacterium]|nr:polysaccharide deacetylase family protein [Syntrophomonadaceae bacterium]